MLKPYRYADPVKPWKNRSFENCTAKNSNSKVVKAGKRIVEPESLEKSVPMWKSSLTPKCGKKSSVLKIRMSIIWI